MYAWDWVRYKMYFPPLWVAIKKCVKSIFEGKVFHTFLKIKINCKVSFCVLNPWPHLKYTASESLGEKRGLGNQHV